MEKGERRRMVEKKGGRGEGGGRGDREKEEEKGRERG